MSLETRKEALKAKHQSLELAIEKEESRPHPDDTELHALKKEKLRIKDEIEGLVHH